MSFITPRDHTDTQLSTLASFFITIFPLGSAHTVLASYWSSRLQKNDLYGKCFYALLKMTRKSRK